MVPRLVDYFFWFCFFSQNILRDRVEAGSTAWVTANDPNFVPQYSTIRIQPQFALFEVGLFLHKILLW